MGLDFSSPERTITTMRFNAKKDMLLEAARCVNKIISPNKNIPEIGCMLVSANAERQIIQLEGTDIRTNIQRRLYDEHVEESGETLVPASLLVDYLSSTHGEMISFDLNHNILHICCETANLWIPTLSPKVFPRSTILFPKDTVKIVGINPLVKRTVYIASEDNIADSSNKSASMEGVKLIFTKSASQAISTDGLRVAIAKSPQCADGRLEMVIHKKALSILGDLIDPSEDLYAGIVNKSAVYFNHDLIFTTMLLSGNFMNVQEVFDHLHSKYYASVDAKEFYNALNIVSGCISKNR